MLLIAGFIAGAINSIAAGGALIAFPAMLLAGLSPLSATITGNLLVWSGQLSAALASHSDIKKIPKRYLSLLLPGFAGGLIGISSLNATSSEAFNKVVPWLLLFTVAVFVLQPFLQKHIHRPAHLRPRISTLAIWSAVFLASVYAGYFGIGAGLMLLTIFGFSRIKSIYQMIGLKNLTGILITLSATIFFASRGKIVWDYGLIMAAGSVLGGFAGGKFAHKISPSTIHWLVSTVGAIVVIAAFIKF